METLFLGSSQARRQYPVRITELRTDEKPAELGAATVRGWEVGHAWGGPPLALKLAGGLPSPGRRHLSPDAGLHPIAWAPDGRKSVDLLLGKESGSSSSGTAASCSCGRESCCECIADHSGVAPSHLHVGEHPGFGTATVPG
jgi:hypothetical protein